MKLAALLATLALAASTASAAPIYRCGTDGRTYSHIPCAEGTVVEASDPRSAAQRAEAKRIVAAERKAAAELERERKVQEKMAQTPAVAGSLSAPPAVAAPASAARAAGSNAAKAKAAKEPDFIAVAPRAKAGSGK